MLRWIGRSGVLLISLKEVLSSHFFLADDLLLFKEALVTRIGFTKSCQDAFSLALGHRVNLAKSKVFFFPNVDAELQASTGGRNV